MAEQSDRELQARAAGRTRLFTEAGEARRVRSRDWSQKREVAAATAAVWESSDSRGSLLPLQGGLDFIEKLLLGECAGRGILAASESGAGPRGAGVPGEGLWTKIPLAAEVLLGCCRCESGPAADDLFEVTEATLFSDCILSLTPDHKPEMSRRAPGSASKCRAPSLSRSETQCDSGLSVGAASQYAALPVSLLADGRWLEAKMLGIDKSVEPEGISGLA